MGIADEVRARRHGSGLSAQRRFTNRTGEIAAFRSKLDEVRALRHDRPELALDVRSPRTNIMTFYGQGGIGKTQLSKECQRLFLDEEAPKGVRRQAIRVDFSEPSARDAELYLFALRAGLARIARSFPAFDTCLALYWSRQHPGLSMTEFVRNQSFLGGAASREVVAENLREFVQGLLDNSGAVVGGTSRAVTLTWGRVRELRLMKTLTRDCPFFEGAVNEPDLDQLRLHLPLLLAWDLAQLQRQVDVDVVVFLDTFEHVCGRRRRPRQGDLEDAIARSAFYLPMVLFAVTTRSRLDWGEARRTHSLEYAGPKDWAGLAATGPASDQQRVGSLTVADCEEHLQVCLVDERGEPAIPAALRSTIARLSGGIPLYLDVAANHFTTLAERQRVPNVDDFARGLPEIVLRLMDDLDEPETDLLRVSALVGVFDRETLRAGLPDLRSSAVEHFLSRSLVIERDDGFFAVHEPLQASVRLQDSATANPWSADEWRAVEERLVRFWSEQFEDPDSRVWQDRRYRSLAFWQLVGLYCTTGVEADRLAEVIMQVQLQGAWATIDAARSQPEALLNDRGRALLLMLDGMMQRQIGELSEADRLLSGALASPALSGDVRRLAMYYLGETRDVHIGNAAALFEQIAQTEDRLGTEARIALAHSRARQRDLVQALSIAQGIEPEGEDPEFKYRLHELLGVIWWSAGKRDLSARHFEATREVAAGESSPLLMALATRHLSLALCWSGPSSLALIDQAEALNRDIGMKPGIGQCLMARATALAGTAPARVVDELLEQSEEAFTSGGYLDDALGPVAVSTFAAAVRGDRALALDRRRVLRERSEGRRVRHWLAVADVWTGQREEFDRVTWPQGAEEAYADWNAVLVGRQRSLG